MDYISYMDYVKVQDKNKWLVDLYLYFNFKGLKGTEITKIAHIEFFIIRLSFFFFFF